MIVSGRGKGKRLDASLSLALLLQQLIDFTDPRGLNKHNLGNSVKSNQSRR